MKRSYLTGFLIFLIIPGTYAQQKVTICLDGRGGGIITFYSEKRNAHRDAEIYVMNADGNNQRPLTNYNGNDYWPSWASFHSEKKQDIYISRLSWQAF